MIISLFFISSILLVEVNGKKSRENLDTANTVIILTTGGITAKMNHDKDNGQVRFPRGDTKSDSPISIEVKGTSSSVKNGGSSDSPGKLIKGFSPSYGNGIAPFTSLEYLYGNRGIFMPSISRIYMQRIRNGDKSESPESKQNEDKNSYLGYYDHHHFHYFRNGHPIIMDHKGREAAVNGEVQHEPPVGDDFRGHGRGHNHHNGNNNNGHGNFHQNHHNGGDSGHGHNNNHHNHNTSDNGYYYHGHYGPDGVIHFQSGNSEGHGHGHGGHSYSYGNGNGYHYYYGNDDRGNGHHHHSNDNPQEIHHNNDFNSNGPQSQYRQQEFGFHDQSNNFNSHGGFRPEGFSENNAPFHGHDQGHNIHGHNIHDGHRPQNFDAGYNERYPFDGPNGEHQFNGHNFRLQGHGNNFPQHSGQDFGHESHNFGVHHHGHSNFGPHDNRVDFPHSHQSHGHQNGHFDVKHRHVTGNPFFETYKSDTGTRNNFHGANRGYRTPMSSPDTEYVLKTRLQNPLIGDVYQSINGERFYTTGGSNVHNKDFVPSDQETDLYRYGEPGGRGEHLNQRQYYRPVHISEDYGHRVYYGNNQLGYSGRDFGGSGYAKRYGYSKIGSTGSKIK